MLMQITLVLQFHTCVLFWYSLNMLVCHTMPKGYNTLFMRDCGNQCPLSHILHQSWGFEFQQPYLYHRVVMHLTDKIWSVSCWGILIILGCHFSSSIEQALCDNWPQETSWFSTCCLMLFLLSPLSYVILTFLCRTSWFSPGHRAKMRQDETWKSVECGLLDHLDHWILEDLGRSWKISDLHGIQAMA